MPGHYGKAMPKGKKKMTAAEKKIHTKSKRNMTHHNHENQKWHPAEELNGRLAMIGIVAALLNYAWTGQIIPGIW